MKRFLLLLVLLLAPGCPGEGPLRPREAGAVKVQIAGRVVDLETCVTQSGCAGVKDVRVQLFADRTISSEITLPDGAFVLPGVPDIGQHFLLVVDAAGGIYLTTLQATPVMTRGVNEYNVELYTLRREGGLFVGLRQALGAELETHALYLGQAFHLKEGKEMTALAGVTVTTAPQHIVRYVDCNPSLHQPPLPPCERVLFDPSRTTTGPYGEFVVVGPEGEDPGVVKISLTAPDHTLTAVSPHLARGHLTLGVHQGQPRAGGDGGPRPDGGSNDGGGKQDQKVKGG